MKKIKLLMITLTISLGLATMLSGCELFGLKAQTDFNRVTNVDTIDAHLYKTAWAYIKARAYGSGTDTIFRRMYDGIIYSGIDTNEYIKPGRTFILLTNRTIFNPTKDATGKVTSWTGVWNNYTNNGVKAQSWSVYPKADIKNYLSYLILLAQYSHYNLPLTDVKAQTLAPAGAYTANSLTFKAPGTFNTNPNSLMLIHVSNANTVTSQLDYPIVLNQTININTSDLLATNGVVSVIDNTTNTVNPYFPAP